MLLLTFMLQYMQYDLVKMLLSGLDNPQKLNLYLIHRSLDQMASRSVQPFFAWLMNVKNNTHRPHYLVYINNPYLMQCMRRTNNDDVA